MRPSWLPRKIESPSWPNSRPEIQSPGIRASACSFALSESTTRSRPSDPAETRPSPPGMRNRLKPVPGVESSLTCLPSAAFHTRVFPSSPTLAIRLPSAKKTIPLKRDRLLDIEAVPARFAGGSRDACGRVRGCRLKARGGDYFGEAHGASSLSGRPGWDGSGNAGGDNSLMHRTGGRLRVQRRWLSPRGRGHQLTSLRSRRGSFPRTAFRGGCIPEATHGPRSSCLWPSRCESAGEPRLRSRISAHRESCNPSRPLLFGPNQDSF